MLLFFYFLKLDFLKKNDKRIEQFVYSLMLKFQNKINVTIAF